MGLRNAQYHAIMREYEKRQLKSHDIQTARYEEVYTKLPEFKSLDDSISILSVQYGKKLLNGDPTALSSLNIGNEKCHCFKKAIIELLYEQSNIKKIPEDADFSNFRLDYYSRSHYDKKTGRSAREAMENTLEICRHFVDSFGTEFHNLFLYGDVGVGKTYLSTCIAKEIINREFSVIYFSAPQLFNTLAQNTFDKKDVDARNMSEYIFECDLLIIDDLGTEYTNSFIASQFFTCINERLLHRKSTIISTNLSLESLADLYTRITSSYSLLKIIGDDIRIKKKLEH